MQQTEKQLGRFLARFYASKQQFFQIPLIKIRQKIDNEFIIALFALHRPMSQVTSGGVDERYLDARLNLPNGVTVLGEALNVDRLNAQKPTQFTCDDQFIRF